MVVNCPLLGNGLAGLTGRPLADLLGSSLTGLPGRPLGGILSNTLGGLLGGDLGSLGLGVPGDLLNDCVNVLPVRRRRVWIPRRGMRQSQDKGLKREQARTRTEGD